MTYVTGKGIGGPQGVRVLRRRSTNRGNLQGYLPRGSTARSERRNRGGLRLWSLRLAPAAVEISGMVSEAVPLDFSERSYIVIWEVTQACDLACVHCRACAQPKRNLPELSTEEGKRLIDEIAEMKAPVFVLTGGDPIKRPDLFELIQYATQSGVRVSLTPSATPLLTREVVQRLKQCGLARLAVSLDGSCGDVHDAFRGMSGSFDRTMEVVELANTIGLPVQINTTFSRRNAKDFENIGHLVESKNIVLWSVFFLVPTGRGRLDDLLSAEEFEAMFAKLYELSRRVEKVRDTIGRAPRGLNDGKGFAFISHLGEVFPSGFLPLSAGNVRTESLSAIYRESPIFQQLRDPSQLAGKCGACEFKHVCGGSRARAYALTGDPLAEEPCCSYVPKNYERSEAPPVLKNEKPVRL